jgi:hypothetical protein
LVGKPEGKRPLGRPRHRRKDNVRMDVRENWVRRYGLDASGSGLEPVAGFCEHDDEPLGFIKGSEFLD